MLTHLKRKKIFCSFPYFLISSFFLFFDQFLFLIFWSVPISYFWSASFSYFLISFFFLVFDQYWCRRQLSWFPYVCQTAKVPNWVSDKLYFPNSFACFSFKLLHFLSSYLTTKERKYNQNKTKHPHINLLFREWGFFGLAVL